MSTPAEEAGFDFSQGEPVDFLAAIVGTLSDIERYGISAEDGERWPRLRTGERNRITGIKRRLIYERDGGCCRNCGISLWHTEIHIDHIIPWSANGSDWSCNLRVLCAPCNVARSNFRSGLDQDQRPYVTTACTGCEPYEADAEMFPAYCGRCGEVGPTWRELVL